jgi:hypothetical protein
MALEKRIGYGCTLAVDEQGGSTFATLFNVVSGFSGPAASADVVETTVLSDKYKSFERSQIDPGSFTFTVAYDPADTASQVLVGLFDSGEVAQWQVTFYDAGSGNEQEEFYGFVESLGREVDKGSLITMDVSIKVSGNPGFTIGAGSH